MLLPLFLRFSPIFGEKTGVFLKNQFVINVYDKIALICVKNPNIFAKSFGENCLKIITLTPDIANVLDFTHTCCGINNNAGTVLLF
jgi:hypothetical protein